MATVTKPIALDESINTTEIAPRNIADVLAQELSGIASAISGGGTGKADETIIADVLPTFVATATIKTKGQQFIYNGVLYEITTTVTAGTSFVVGTNVKVADTIVEQISNNVITKSRIAKFTLPSEAQGMSDQVMTDVNGSWTIEDASLYTSSSNVLTVLKAGVYEVSTHFHGLINPDTYVEEVAVASGIGGIVQIQSVGVSGVSIQGFANGCKILYIPANTTIRLQAYTSSLSNYLYGSALSSNNSVVVTKLG